MSVANFRMIRLAREMRAMSQTKLGREAGIPQAVLSRIEGNLRDANEAELIRIARALDMPRGFFLEPDMPAAAPLFRKRAIRSAVTNRMIQARVNMAVLTARRVLDAGVQIDAPLTLPSPGEVPADDPLEASKALRRAWRMPNGRVDNVTGLIEAAGGIVLHADLGTDDVSAAFVSTLGDHRLWFLVNTRETAGDRVRLSLAHELGHAVMHRNLPVHDEGKLEPDAYEFAVALTLPPIEFDRQVSEDLTLRRARDLKRAYWISVQAIIRAAKDRHLISGDRYTSLYKQISARGWRRDEPDPVPVEMPTVWPSALRLHRLDHGLSDEELASIARVTLTDLSSLFPRDFLHRLRALDGDGTSCNSPSTGPGRTLRSV